jgi:hypothetical protein
LELSKLAKIEIRKKIINSTMNTSKILTEGIIKFIMVAIIKIKGMHYKLKLK